MLFMVHKIEERAAPDIPEEDLRVNEQLHDRIVQTQEYKSQRWHEFKAREIEWKQLK
jgi:hypothetical protein